MEQMDGALPGSGAMALLDWLGIEVVPARQQRPHHAVQIRCESFHGARPLHGKPEAPEPKCKAGVSAPFKLQTDEGEIQPERSSLAVCLATTTRAAPAMVPCTDML